MEPITYPARPLSGGRFGLVPKQPVYLWSDKLNGWRAPVHVPTGTMFNRQGEELSIAGEFTQVPGTAQTNLSPDGRPIVPPAFYITSYTQLTTNGVDEFPDPDDWQPRALLEWLSLPIGEHQPTMDPAETKDGKRLPLPDSFTDVCNHFAWRGFICADQYDTFNLDPRHTFADLEKAFQREETGLAYWQDEKAAEEQRQRIHAAFEILKNLMCSKRAPMFADLSDRQDFVIRHFCAAKIKEYSVNAGEYAEYPIGPILPGFDPAKPETDTRPKRRVKCVFSPSLADLSYTAFECVVIDEGVKMKGEDTLVGKGVRSMAPRYRLVLTATPIKNRLPDIFRLAWWATGGKAEAHARFPYRDDPTERSKFAETFMVTERNLTREAEEKGKKKSASRFKKQTAEVCNVHRLWKLFGPIVLRRRKQDAGEDIVPKVRRVVRCEMGSLQKKVYGYHLEAEYRDINGLPAIGAQLQALRIAAADPSNTHLVAQPGAPSEDCDCHLENGIVKRNCPRCQGRGTVPLPSRSGTAYVPKMATVLTIINEILERQEQAIIFSAFNDPLDHLSRWLFEVGVRHIVLDGRVSQKKRGEKAALLRRAGRTVVSRRKGNQAPGEPLHPRRSRGQAPFAGQKRSPAPACHQYPDCTGLPDGQRPQAGLPDVAGSHGGTRSAQTRNQRPTMGTRHP